MLDQAHSFFNQKQCYALPPSPPKGRAQLQHLPALLQTSRTRPSPTTSNRICYSDRLQFPRTSPHRVLPRLSPRKRGTPQRQISTTEELF